MPQARPNYTMIPNDFLGTINDGKPCPGLLAELNYAELKLILVIYRHTFGYHRDAVRVSLSVLQEMAGLSRRGAIDGLKKLVLSGLVKKSRVKGVNVYDVVLECEVAAHPQVQSEVTSLDNPEGANYAPSVVKETTKDLKEVNTELKTKDLKDKSSGNGKGDHKVLMGLYQEALGYPIPNGAQEGAAAKWLLGNGYTPQQIISCYHYLHSRDFRDKSFRISLQTVKSHIGEWIKNGEPEMNGRKAVPKNVYEQTWTTLQEQGA